MTEPADPHALDTVRSTLSGLAPTRAGVLLLGCWATLGFAASVWPPVVGAWVVCAAATVVVLLLDTLWILRTPSPRLQRTVANALSLNEWHDATIRVENPSLRALSIEVIDASPTEFETEGLPFTVEVEPGKWVECTWRLRPTARGEFQLPWMEMRFASPLGLVQHRRRVAARAPIRVYPNFRAVSQFALLALDNRVAELGVHTRQRRGQGLEFQQLREYREGDPLRQIDWKAVSRRNQLISREYREEQNQQVIFLLDCGRKMRSREGDLAFFDHVLNAVLLVSYVALKQGDAVGAFAFSGSDCALPPRKGTAAMNGLLNGLYDLQPTTAPSDYSEAAARITTRLKRRALIILVTNLRDEDAHELPAALAPLRRKHLVLLASLREPSIEQVCDAPIHDLADALRVASAHEYLKNRRRAHELIRGRGVRTLDVPPASLPVALVNRYLDIKRSGAL